MVIIVQPVQTLKWILNEEILKIVKKNTTQVSLKNIFSYYKPFCIEYFENFSVYSNGQTNGSGDWLVCFGFIACQPLLVI